MEAPQRLARITGACYLAVALLSVFAIIYVQSVVLVPGDGQATLTVASKMSAYLRGGGVLIPLIVGGTPGTFLGARIANWVSQSVIRRGIVIVLTLTGLKMLGMPPEWVGIIDFEARFPSALERRVEAAQAQA